MKSYAKMALLTCVMFANLQTSAFATVGSDGRALKSEQPVLDRNTAAAAAQPDQQSVLPTRVFKIHAGVSPEYVLGPGDIMAITDTSEDKAAVQTVPILPDGTAVTSYTGVIQAAGLTIREMNDLINRQAEKWYVNPHLMINLAKQRTMQVYLLGEVDHPGLYQMGGTDSGMMTPQGGNDDASDAEGGGGMAGMGGAGASTLTVSGALQMAGGIKETADVRRIRVTRSAPKQVFQIDFWKLMIDGDVSEDISLQPGDVIYVPKGGAEFDSTDLGKVAYTTKKVRMYGSFKNPGLFSMTSDDDVLSAIAKAGGFAINASTRYVWFARLNHDGTVSTEKISVKKGLKDEHSEMRTRLRAGDLIIAKTSPTRVVASVAGRMAPQMLMYAVMYSLVRP